jgi:uncharacterized C2H2 Zn-finger protein
MIGKLAGIKALRLKIKELIDKIENKKAKPGEIAQWHSDLQSLKTLFNEEKEKSQAKRVEKQKAKDELAKEATPKVEDGTVSMPKKEFVDEHEKLVKELEPMVEEHKEQGAELKEVKEAAPSSVSPKCAICGVSFKSQSEYQQHKEDAHGHRDYQPMDPAVKRDVVKNVEHKLGPAIISEKEDSAELHKYSVDEKVEPIRGGKSVGRVMRHDDNNPATLVYVYWDEGPLAEKDHFGGYYNKDLQRHEEPKEINAEGNPPPPDTSILPKEENCPCYEDMSVYCPKCKTKKTSDLKSNYEDMLKDLKKEREDHYQQSNHPWVAKLDEKIKNLEEKIQEKFGNEKTSGAQNDSEGLVVMDHLPPRANKTKDEGGRDGVDEFQDLWAGPAGTEKESSLKINVFNKSWTATPVKKANKLGYDISDEKGTKVLHLSPLNGKEMNAEHLKWAAERELVKNYKKATLTEKVSFLNAGTKVFVLASDKARKRVKIASLEHNVRAWVPEAKLKIEALESQTVQYNGQPCKVLGATSTQTLVDSPTEGPIWVNSTELLDANRPPATPEALNEQPIEEEAAKDCPDCHGTFAGKENEKCPTCGRFSVTALKTALPPTIPNQRGYLDNPPVEKDAGYGTDYSGYTNRSTWGLSLWLDNDQALYDQSRQFAQEASNVNELAQVLKDAYGNLLVEKQEEDMDPNEVNWTEIAQDLLNEAAENKEYERSQGAGGVIDKLPTMDVEQAKDDLLNQLAKETDPERKKVLEQKYKRLSMNSSLNKVARVVHQKDGWHVLSEKGKNLGGPYKTKGEAVKRLRAVEYFKSHKGSLVKGTDGKVYKIGDCNFDTDMVNLDEVK